MNNRTRQTKISKRLSRNTDWTYFMQAIEPTSEAINQAYPEYHPQWISKSQKISIGPDNFKFFRTRLGMTKEQCAAYLRVSDKSVLRWENGSTPVPFAEFELLRLIYESVLFKLSHKDWDGWFITDDGKLISPFNGEAFTPDELNTMWLKRSAMKYLESENERLKQTLDEATIENTRIRQLFLSHGVVDELHDMHSRMNDLINSISTAHVLPFKGKDESKMEKVA